MTWREEQHDDEQPWRRLGRPGGDWQGLRPRFDNPMTWAFGAGSISGISIRIHIVFVLFIAIELLRPLVGVERGAATPLPFGHAAAMLGILFAIVLVHELGHCLACRWVGGTADEILMWPLGGLAYCHPGHHWRNHLITVMGGPAVNVIICLIAMPCLIIATGAWWGVAIPNPFNLWGGLYHEQVASIALQLLYLVNAISFLLLLFNMLPIFPLDGGRLLQALLWPSMGYTGSMRLSTRVGLIGAVVLLVVGFIIYNLLLIAIAVFGIVTCWMTSKQVEFSEQFIAEGVDDYALGYLDDQDYRDDDTKTRLSRKERREEKQRKAKEEESKQIDSILEKIADRGIDSLSMRERRILKRVSERKRNS